MRHPSLLAIVLVASGCIHFPSYRRLVTPGATGRIVFRDAAVFTATATELLTHQDVWVEDGLITAVEPTGGTKSSDLVIDARGKTLMPGLVDAHVHATMSPLPPWYAAMPNPGHTLEAMLYAGITTVNDLGGSIEDLLTLRSEIADGTRMGPRIFFAGKSITHEGGYPASMIKEAYGALAWAAIGTKLTRQIVSPEEGALAVRQHAAAGATMIKVVVADIPHGAPRLSAAELDAIVHQAHQLGLFVIAHIDTSEDALMAARHHVDALAHGIETTPLTPEQAAELAASGIVMVPTLVNYERFASLSQKRFSPLALTVESEPADTLEQFSPKYVDAATLTPGFQKWRDELEANVDTRSKNVALAWKAGVPIVAGADAMGSVATYAADLHHELVMLVAAGIPPAEVLLAATSRAARFITPRPSFGTIEVGKSADLLLIDGDPLQDISATQRISTVMARGRVIDRAVPTR